MKTVTFTTDLRNKIEMSLEEFKTAAVEAIEFAINEKDYSITDLTVELIAEDISGVVKSYHNMQHEMNEAGLAIIEAVLSEMKNNREIEQHWIELADIPFDDVEGEDLEIAEDWLHFKKGTKRDDIWHWFDEQHTQGIIYLLNEFEEV